MTNEEMLREYIALPPSERRLIADMIIALRKRYGSPPLQSNLNKKDLSHLLFTGMWKDRVDMNDSSIWVRQLRENDWGN